MTAKILLLATALALPALQAQDRMQPGNWEVVYTGDNPHTTTTCITRPMIQGINGTPAEVRADTEKMAAQRKMKVENYKFDGTTISYTAVGADRTFVNSGSYHGDTYESLIVTKRDGKEFTTRQKGRRLGACP